MMGFRAAHGRGKGATHVGGIVALLLAVAPVCDLAAALPKDVSASLDFRDGAWRLTARRGESVLRRDLRLPADDCALAVDTAALAVDRFLRALGPAPKLRPAPRRDPRPTAIAQAFESDASHPRPVPLPEPAPAPSIEPPRHVLLPEADLQSYDLTSDPPPRQWTLAVSAGAAGVLAGDDVRPGIWLDLTARTGRWAMSVSLATATGTADLQHRYGSNDGMTLDSGLLAFSAKPCIDWGVRACLGPYVGARLISGDSLRESFVALQAEGGGALQLDRDFANGFHFSASLLAGYTAGPLSREAQETAGSRVDVTVALTLGYQVF